MTLGGVLGGAWQAYGRTWPSILAIALLLWGITLGLDVALVLALGEVGVVFGAILDVLSLVIVAVAVVATIAERKQGLDTAPIRAIVARTWSATPAAFAVSVLAGLAIAAGTIALVVPGLYLVTIWSLVLPVVVLERGGVLAAFRRSRSLVSGHGWTVGGVLLTQLVVEMVLVIAVKKAFADDPALAQSAAVNLLIDVLLIPFHVVVLTVAYLQLTAESERPSLASAVRGPRRDVLEIPPGAAYRDEDDTQIALPFAISPSPAMSSETSTQLFSRLERMTSTGLLADGWAIYRRFWRHLVPIAFVIFLVVSAIELVLVKALGGFGSLLGSLVSLIGLFLLQATLVEAVADVRDGRVDLSARETISRGWSRVPAALAVGVPAALGIALGFVLLIFPGLWLLTIWSLVIPVAVLERVGFAAFGRSRSLVSGHGWTVFGTILLIFLVDIVVGIVLAIVLRGLSSEVRSFISNLVSNTVFAPFISATITSMYFRLRAEEPGPLPAGAAFRED